MTSARPHETAGVTLTFYIEWAAIPTVLREFHGGRKSGRWPRGEWGIVSTRLNAGPQMKPLPDIPEVGRDEFAVAPEPGLEDKYVGGWDPAFLAAERAKLLDFDSFGARLDRLLREEAIPLWRRMLDRDFLAHPDWAGYFLGGRTGIREAILYVDDGEPAQVAAWLDQAALAATARPDRPPVDPTLVEWLRRRLAARTRER